MPKQSGYVNVPRTYKTPGSHKVELAYITKKEAKKLKELDLHNSGIGKKMHYGPKGIPNYDGGGGGFGGGFDGGDGDGGDWDWGMGPEGSEGTRAGSSRSGEDRDFGDDVSLQQKTAFMATTPSVVAPVSNVTNYLEDVVPPREAFKTSPYAGPPRATPIQAIDPSAGVPGGPETQSRTEPVSTYDASSSPVSNIEGTINQPGGPMSALDLALGVPKNMADEIYQNLEWAHPFLESGVSKEETDRLIDIFAKGRWDKSQQKGFQRYSNIPTANKNIWEGFPTGSKAPWDKTLQDLNKEWELGKKFPGNFLGPSYKKAGWTDTKPMATWERPPATRKPGYIDPSTYSSAMGGVGEKKSNYGAIRKALEKSYQKSPSSTKNYIGPWQKNVQKLAQLEEEALANQGFFGQWNPYSDFSKTGNIYNRSILEANMLADKYANMYGLPKNAQEAAMNTYEMSSGVPGQTLPPHANRYTMYDLARHGFLASQTGLIPAQLTENVGSSGQSSDYINNILANKFMRPGGTMMNNLSSLLGTSQIPNKNQKMNEWMQLVYKEMANPGSTGYNFNFNIND